MKPLFPRYPGSKRSYALIDGYPYDAVIEPFVGGGSFFASMIDLEYVRSLYISDSDPRVLAVYKTWVNRKLNPLFPDRLQSVMADLERRGLLLWFVSLKEAMENADQGIKRDPALLAAQSLVIRDAVHRGIMRFNLSGEFNTPLEKPYRHQKILANYSRGRYNLPAIPDNLGDRVYLHSDALKCLRAARRGEFEQGICLIDPPYVDCGSVYPGDAGKQDWGALCLKAVKMALANPKIKKVIVFNYYRPELDEALLALANRHHVKRTVLTRLTRIANGKSNIKTSRFECRWEFDKLKWKQLELDYGNDLLIC